MSTWKTIPCPKSSRVSQSSEDSRMIGYKRYTPRIGLAENESNCSSLKKCQNKSVTNLKHRQLQKNDFINLIDPLRNKKSPLNLQNSRQRLNMSGLFTSAYQRDQIKKEYSQQIQSPNRIRENPEKRDSFKKIIPDKILEEDSPLRKKKFKLKSALQRVNCLKKDHQQMKKFINLQSTRYKIEMKSTIDFLKRGLAELSSVDNVKDVISPKNKSKGNSQKKDNQQNNLQQIRKQAMKSYSSYMRQIAELQRERQSLIRQHGI